MFNWSYSACQFKMCHVICAGTLADTPVTANFNGPVFPARRQARFCDQCLVVKLNVPRLFLMTGSTSVENLAAEPTCNSDEILSKQRVYTV